MLPGGVHILCMIYDMITGLFYIQILNGISQRRLGTERKQSNDTANQQKVFQRSEVSMLNVFAR